MIDYSVLVKLLMTTAAICVLICRLDKMTVKTRRSVRYQHSWLCASLLFSLTLPPDWANAALCLGVLIYFSYSTRRWRHGPPEGTTRPMFMKQEDLSKVHGGVND